MVPVAPKPLFRDPVFDGAADPVVIWSRAERRWLVFYTARRAKLPASRGVEWVHGTRIGVAESPDGAAWSYRGVVELPLGEEAATLWAPEVVEHGGRYHMFVSVVPGVFADWEHPRYLVHLTSPDLRRWAVVGRIPLPTDRAIDACVHPLPGGGLRLWYNDERDGKSIHVADSRDLRTWSARGRARGACERPGEGPYVFTWRGQHFMLVDVWSGLAVYRSLDLETWTAQPGELLGVPGAGPDDGVNGGHASVLRHGDRALVFYFTHPERAGTIPLEDVGYPRRRSSLQVAELREAGGRLECERDAPVEMGIAGPVPESL